MDVNIYILTHKKFNENYDDNIYKPLLNGSVFHNEDFGYIRDDTNNNISKHNPKYSELTGQYWAWKNSTAEIIGFCHYRRWFVKNIIMQKLTKKDIINDLSRYDIIVPQKRRFECDIHRVIVKNNIKDRNYGVHQEDYQLLEEIIKTDFHEYLDSYKKMMSRKFLYLYNMFICKKELSNEYFTWVFEIIKKLDKQIDFSKYPSNPRIYGFISELLINVFIIKHELKVKEHYIFNNEISIPQVSLFNARFPKIKNFEYKIYNNLKSDK